ncbi:heavy metal-binding domain-containing protein [Algoriphagus kandeliae]|uniref:Heavy metal-binding domain-containing protein n=1 Tax=Algoriphagus kandeliae TaxID=2562278 RepID=A0A4Y9QTC4_9BACT|nr:heavy metal-binding domain-containing protein [Algoriphagus kandeliae]TFV95804.1 heavy metal-binding domain-containing protein [Algoriphagus kandeliae]
MTKEICPNCGAKIGFGLVSSNHLQNENVTRFLNDFTESKAEAYCEKCYPELFHEANKNYQPKLKQAKDFISNHISELPILTIHQPPKWDYEPVSIVTAQLVAGTGLVAEVVSSWSDFFGSNSNTYRQKLIDAEENCKQQLRAQALKLKCHAIIATDIDYSEAGAGKGMLMVCMAGTAVKIKNLQDLGENFSNLDQLIKESENFEILDSYNARVPNS